MADTATFRTFAVEAERRLRLALTPSHGPDATGDGITDALVYAWKNWERVKKMENPFGYLYRIASRVARRRRPEPRHLAPVEAVAEPEFEPALPAALERLSGRQRTVAVLVEGYGWTHGEVAELLGISKSSVRRHRDRGLSKLRRALGVDDG